MKHQHLARIAVCVAAVFATSAVFAQSSASQQRLEEGIEAFRAERFAEAKTAFEQAVAADESNAEAHYMLSRVYYETPLFDKGEAGRAIRQARKLDPDAVEYMVAELQQLRLPSWSNVAEFVQQEKRRALAQQILAVDSTNAFAHEELGATYIRDFWQYRNAIAFPELSFSGRATQQTYREDNTPSDIVDQNPDDARVGAIQEARQTDGPGLGAAGSIAVPNLFDVETLKAQGAGVLDLSRRADVAYDKAVGHLEKSIQYDPRRRPSYDHLMRIYALRGDYERALNVMSKMTVFLPDDSKTWAYLGLANHRLGRTAAAAKSFDEALDRMEYQERAAFNDLAVILTEEERAEYSADSSAYATRYWTSQNPRYLTPYNERKLEHYARLVYADLLYAAEDVGLRGWDTRRGQMVVRYGPPENEIMITGRFGELVSNFGIAASLAEDEASPRFFRDFDIAEETNLFNIWDYGDLRFVFEDPLRNGEFRLYSPPADFFAGVNAGFVDRMDYEIIARNAFKEQPERYVYESPGRDIRVPFLATAFKGEGSEADLYVHYGIPLAPSIQADDDLLNLTVRTGTFVINEDRDIVAERRRTLYGLSTSQVVSFDEARLWTDSQALEARPGTQTVSVEFETAGGGAQAAQRREVEVPDFSAGSLALSDLMLAYQVEEDFSAGEDGVRGGRLRRGNFVVQPAPWSVFNAEQPVYVYFETYSLQPDGANQNQYTVEVALQPKDTSSGIARLARRVFGGDDGGVSVEFEAGGTGSDDATYAILDASDQEPGVYTLTLRVRDTASGQTAERTTDLFLE